MKEKLKVLSLFSGAGGMDLAFSNDSGFEIVGHVEIDKHAVSVLRYHNPRIKNYGDITKVNKRELPLCDIVVGGSPCQSFSVAGRRTGLRGESGLFYHFVETIKEKDPSYFIWENVKGSLSSSGGWDMANVHVAMAEAGYDIEWEVLNAREFGVPQNRERIFIFGCRRKEGERKILPKRRDGSENSQGKSDNSQNREIKVVGNVYENKHSTGRIYSTDGIAPSLRSQQGCAGAPIIFTRSQRTVAYSKSTRDSHLDHRVRIDDTANTLNTGDGCRTQSSVNYIAEGSNIRLRKLTPLECERLMSWPDNYTKFGVNDVGDVYEVSDKQRYKMIGNGVVTTCLLPLIEKIKKMIKECSQ